MAHRIGELEEKQKEQEFQREKHKQEVEQQLEKVKNLSGTPMVKKETAMCSLEGTKEVA